MSEDLKKPVDGNAASASLGKWLLGAAAVAVVGGGGYVAYQATRSPERMVVVATMDAGPRAMVVADAAPRTADAAPRTADAAPVAARIDAGPARNRVSPQAALAEESRLLGQAQEAMTAGDARGALRWVTNHARSFPHGKRTEERERLAIEALVRLGRRADAEARAERFRRRYPRSAQWPRIRELLDR